MKMFKVVPAVLITFLAALLLVAITGSEAAESMVKIGMITSLTGPMAPAFKDLADAAKPTADLLNKRGGITIQGKKYLIEIVTEDDQSSPPGAVAATNRLIQQGVKFVLPPLFIPSNMAMTPLAEDAKVLSMKAMGAVRDQANPNLRYSFVASTFVYNSPVGYDYLQKHYPKAKKIAIISPDDPVGKIYRELSEKEIKARTLDLVFEEQFKIGSEDFYPLLTRAFQKKPDAMDIVFSIEPWSAAIINQSRELGFTGPIYASVGLLGDINILKGMIEPKYAYDLFQMGADVQSPKMPSIVKDYRAVVAQYVKTPFNTSHLAVLDAVYVLVQGIEKAQSLDTDKVAQALEGMKSIDTVYGRGRMAGEDFFGVKHVVRRPIALSGIVDGKVFCEFSGKD
ncbi:MAG: ABC transporter substrate-binding protein [Syntrophorhabdales bacterium]|jgi:ABC-type branched-subunit amino acid transport system substrate-binding protein